MQIFLSWSGDESKAVARALKNWLPLVIQSARPYMSADDNVAGERWGDTVNSQLQDSQFGIICLTPSNLDARWLLYEAGALGKLIGTAHVVPFLHRLNPSDVKPPLAQFMMKESNKEGVRGVLTAINQEITSPLEDRVLDQTFEAMWPKIERELRDATAPTPSKKARRSDRELIEEVLALVREQSRMVNEQDILDHADFGRYEYSESRARIHAQEIARGLVEESARKWIGELLALAGVTDARIRRRGGTLVVWTPDRLDSGIAEEIEQSVARFDLKTQFEIY